MTIWQEQYRAKVISLEEGLSKIKDNDQIICGLSGSEPRYILRHLHTIADRVKNVTVVNCLPLENYEFFMNPQYKESFFTEGWYYSPGLRKAHPQSNVSHIPCHLHLAARKRLFHRKCNVFLGIATPPDKYGFMSLSLGVTYEREVMENADLVILQVNEKLPRTFGDTIIHVSDVDYVVEHTEDLPLLPSAPSEEKDEIIGKYIAELVEDGSTIQLGIGGIPNAVAKELREKRDLGIHTEMFVDGMVDLYEAGAVTGRKKGLLPGKMVATFVLGTQRLYDFVHDNPGVVLMNGCWTNDPYVISQNHKMVSINTTLEVDLTGQCCSESIGHRQFTGTGGQSDTATGAQKSPGGKSIIALHSTAEIKDPVTGEKKIISKIVPRLTPGAVVSLSRNDVDYVVTEYGIASLRGTSVRERVKRLIAVSHPDFRSWLQKESQELMIW
ncbi:MAG: cat2 [Peptococcaceae bacterium]|nr:cat2 [Peptococcaceae bacterium]